MFSFGIWISIIVGIVTWIRLSQLIAEQSKTTKKISGIVDTLNRLEKKFSAEKATTTTKPEEVISTPLTLTALAVEKILRGEDSDPQTEIKKEEVLEPTLPSTETRKLPITFTPPPPSQLEVQVTAIIAKIWSWVLVGEEHRPKNVPIEFAVASTWLMRVGIIILVTCVGWFLKWSMDHGLLGPSGRVGLSLMAGLGLTVTGYLQIGKRYQLLGQGLLGGGLAALYFAVYAAGPLYGLLSQIPCFACMALITVAAGVLANVTRSQATAILALIGGYGTPVILSTGQVNFLGLYGYLFLLGFGILGLAVMRNWRLLHYLAFVAHWSLVAASLRPYSSTRDFAIVLPFLSLFFLQHHGITIGYAIRRRLPTSLLESLHQLINTSLFAAIAYFLIQDRLGRPWPAILSVSLAALFIGQVLWVISYHQKDKQLLTVSLGLAGFFTAWSIPLLVEGPTLTIAWSLMALCWMWMGLRIQSKILIMASIGLYALVIGHVVFIDIDKAFAVTFMNPDFGACIQRFFFRALNFGTVIGSLLVAAKLWQNAGLSHKENQASHPWLLSPNADLGFIPSPIWMRLIFTIIGSILFFVIATLEDRAFFQTMLPAFVAGSVSVLWAAFAIALIALGLRRNIRQMRLTGLALFAIVSFKVFLLDLEELGMIWRVMAFLVVGLVLLLGSFVYIRASHDEKKKVEC